MLWSLIRSHGRPYLFHTVMVVVLQLISTLAVLLLPSLNARIIDQGVAVGDTSYIWNVGWMMIAVAFTQVVSAVAAMWFGARVSMAVGRDLRRTLYVHVNTLSPIMMDSFGTPSLVTRNTNDVQQIQMVLLMVLNFMIIVPIMSVGGIVMALREDTGLSWLVWTSVSLVLVLMVIFIRFLTPLYNKMQDNIDSINSVVREQILGMRTVRAFTRENHETKRFSDANSTLTSTSINIGRLVILIGPVVTAVLHTATAAVLWFGALRVSDQALTVGSLTALLQYLLQILASVLMGSFLFVNVPRALVCGRRISAVLNTRNVERNAIQKNELHSPHNSVEIHRVTFSYPGAAAPVLDDISISFPTGATTAILGGTGSGKSTLLGLIAGLHTPSSGEVLLNRIDISTQLHSKVSSGIGFVPQRSLLFSGTVAENLRFGDPKATDAELWRALEVAQGAEFIRNRTTTASDEVTSGLQSTISQGGMGISGGQRQRLCIARALVGNPKLYLLDDPFSALDAATELRLRASFSSHTRNDTVIMVAQRVEAVAQADQIIVLDAGKVAGCGTHQELLKSSQIYKEILESQRDVGVVA